MCGQQRGPATQRNGGIMRQGVAKRPMLVLGSLLVLAAGCAGPAERGGTGRWVGTDVAPGVMGAAEAPAPAAFDEGTGVQEYIAHALEHNPRLAAALAEWQAALERAPQARTLPDPVLSYQLEAMSDRRQHQVMVSQALPWFGKLDLRAGVAQAEADAARQRYEAEKWAVVREVQDAYVEYYYLARAIAVVRENRDLMKYLEEVVRARYAASVAGHPDVIRAQVELGKLDDELRTLADSRSAWAARLNAVLNRPAEAPLPWPRTLAEEPIETSDGRLLEMLRQGNPELKALDAEVARQERAIRLAEKDYWPDLMLGAGYMREQMSDGGEGGVMAMVGATLPIWREKYAAGVREAERQHDAAVKRRADRANALAAQVADAAYRLRDARRKMGLYGNTLLPKGKESLKATEAAFRAGRASFTDVVDAERVLLEFQLSYERALADHAQRLAEVEMLVGRRIPRAGEEAPAEPGEQTRATERGSAMRTLLIAVAVVGLALAAGCRQSEPTQPAAEGPAGQAIAQKICPVMGEPIDPAVYTDYEGRRIYFCCQVCKAAFEKDPAKYVAKVDEELKAAGETPPMEMPADMPHEHQ